MGNQRSARFDNIETSYEPADEVPVKMPERAKNTLDELYELERRLEKIDTHIAELHEERFEVTSRIGNVSDELQERVNEGKQAYGSEPPKHYTPETRGINTNMKGL